jgi:hypothetical protein
MIEPVLINKKSYYIADDVKKEYPKYFKGTSRTVRNIIDKKSISNKYYEIAIKHAKEGWKKSDFSSKKAKLLLLKSFCEDNIFRDAENIVEKEKKPIEKIPEAPPIIILEEEEMFKDCDGNVLNIEVRGERDENGIYFYCKDVANAFNLPNLNKNLNDKNTSYKNNEDYVLFNRPHSMGSVKNKPIKTLFLTYEGILHVLYSNRNKNTRQFRSWATKTLFTHQFGTQEQKDKLGAELQNIKYQSFTDVFRKYNNKLSVIYLIRIGKVKDMRKSLDIPSSIPDTNYIYKYGFTDDLNRRYKEHVKTYSQYEGSNIEMETFSFVEPKYNSNAETDIKDINDSFNTIHKFEKFSELIILDIKQKEATKKIFQAVSKKYMGYSEELQKEISELRNEIEILKMENKHLVEKQELEIKNLNLEIENRDMKIKLLEMEKCLNKN